MREVHFTTPQQAGQYLAQTLKIIEHADVPDDLRGVAFTAIFAAVAGKQVFMDQSDASGGVLLAAPRPGNDNLQ